MCTHILSYIVLYFVFFCEPMGQCALATACISAVIIIYHIINIIVDADSDFHCSNSLIPSPGNNYNSSLFITISYLEVMCNVPAFCEVRIENTYN